jgi:hypothetical protein
MNRCSLETCSSRTRCRICAMYVIPGCNISQLSTQDFARLRRIGQIVQTPSSDWGISHWIFRYLLCKVHATQPLDLRCPLIHVAENVIVRHFAAQLCYHVCERLFILVAMPWSVLNVLSRIVEVARLNPDDRCILDMRMIQQ